MATRLYLGLSMMVIVSLAILTSGCTKKDGATVQEGEVKELFGSTPEERLGARMDIRDARFTLIADVESLRSQHSAVFENAENGHYLVELPNRIMIYNFEEDEIVSDFQFQTINLGEQQS